MNYHKEELDKLLPIICTYFLHQQYTGEPIRSINISLTNLIREGEEQISLFDNVTQREQEVKLTKVMDEIRTNGSNNTSNPL
nr:hypothetical protein [Bacillus mycoides]